ncbi:MAG TPA: hypothetical protein VEQ59_09365 [Polyangiaceae bacterium]|nr:hypothetical protein [Polyangiaceae bacterium]
MAEPAGKTRGRSGSRAQRETGLGWLLALGSLLAGVRCTFPEYDLVPRGGGGATSGGGSVGGNDNGGGNGAADSGGGGGNSGTGLGGSAQGGSVAGTGQGATSAGTLGEGASNAGGAEVGGGPACSGEQWPVEQCASECLTRYPAHCYDGDENEDETDVDCGGACQGCSNEVCDQNNGCLSGRCEATTEGGLACHAPLTVSLTAQDPGASVGSTSFTLRLRNAEATDGKSFTLSDLELRYYFARSGIVEPLQVGATQSTLIQANGDSRMLPQTSWSIERFEPVTAGAYDAYLAIAFADSGKLAPGDRIEVRQQMMTGFSGTSDFDQIGNYSFGKASDGPWLHVTAFHRGGLVWGLEPQPANPRACLARAVNLNGAAVTIAGNDWQAAAAASLTTTGSAVTQAGTTVPPTTGDVATMLSTSVRLQTGQDLDWPVEDGTYLVYLDAISSANDTSVSHFTLQGVEPDSSGGFKALMVSPRAAAWARLGPFRLSVNTGKLSLAVTRGAINFAGIELWYPE